MGAQIKRSTAQILLERALNKTVTNEEYLASLFTASLKPSCEEDSDISETYTTESGNHTELYDDQQNYIS